MKKVSKKIKKMPTFSSEAQEREFWATHDSTEYIDWSRAVINPHFLQLTPSTKTISIRLPEWLLADLKALAREQDVPYQSLVKIYLAEKVAQADILRDSLPAKKINKNKSK